MPTSPLRLWSCFGLMFRVRRALLGVMVLTNGLSAAAANNYQASVTVDVARPLGRINPDIYGQYLEHVNESDECIYRSIWDDKSRFADAMGLRKDVIEAARGLEVPIIRWPGGCFADVYHWENGIGPRSARPLLPNGHWKGNKESHQFGTDEFLRWAEQLGAKPYINVNLGSGTLDEALRWLEYCNGAADTPQGRRRSAHGRNEPYAVKHWGIGNETWGPWETGHSDALTYAKNLRTWAEAMRRRDSSIKILGVGSSEGANPAWDLEVLNQAGHLIDYLTLHIYGHSTDYSGSEYDQVVFTPHYFDFRFRQMLKTLDDYKAKSGSTREILVSVDEWNIRHYDGTRLMRRDPRNMQDAIFVSGVLNVMLRHSPRIAMANYVFLINGHAPLIVNADQVVRTPLFYIFRQYARWMKGQTVAVTVKSPTRLAPPPMLGNVNKTVTKNYEPGEVPFLDSSAALHDDGTLVLSLVNRHQNDAADVSLQLPAGYVVHTAWTLQASTPYIVNDFDRPDRIKPVATKVEKSVAKWNCAPTSTILLVCQPGN